MRHDDGHCRTDRDQTVIKESLVLRPNSTRAPMSSGNRTARLGAGLAALTVLVAPRALMAPPSAPAAASSLGPAASHVLRANAAVTATAPANANWPTFHGNAQLTGVSHDTSISASNAAQLGVRWMTHTFGPVLSSPVTHYSGSLNKTLAYVANEKGEVEAVDTANGSIVWAGSFGVPVHATPHVPGSHGRVGTGVSRRRVKLAAITGT